MVGGLSQFSRSKIFLDPSFEIAVKNTYSRSKILTRYSVNGTKWSEDSHSSYCCQVELFYVKAIFQGPKMTKIFQKTCFSSFFKLVPYLISHGFLTSFFQYYFEIVFQNSDSCLKNRNFVDACNC